MRADNSRYCKYISKGINDRLTSVPATLPGYPKERSQPELGKVSYFPETFNARTLTLAISIDKNVNHLSVFILDSTLITCQIQGAILEEIYC